VVLQNASTAHSKTAMPVPARTLPRLRRVTGLMLWKLDCAVLIKRERREESLGCDRLTHDH
jgi:hypothetical protein